MIKNSQSEAIILGITTFGAVWLGLGYGLGLGLGLVLGLGFGLGLGLGGRVKGWPSIYKFTAPKVVIPIYWCLKITIYGYVICLVYVCAYTPRSNFNIVYSCVHILSHDYTAALTLKASTSTTICIQHIIHPRSMTNIVNMLRAILKVNTRAEYSTYIGASQ